MTLFIILLIIGCFIAYRQEVKLQRKRDEEYTRRITGHILDEIERRNK